MHRRGTVIVGRGEHTLAQRLRAESVRRLCRAPRDLQPVGRNQHVVAGSLYLGYAGSSGTYNLSGTGQLRPRPSSRLVPARTGPFQQTGGANAATYLSIGSGGTSTNSAAARSKPAAAASSTKATFDGANSGGLTANCIVDLSSGTWKNVGSCR